MNITDLFIDKVIQASRIQLSPEILTQIKRCVLDYICVTYAGRKYIGSKLDEFKKHGKSGNCSIIGTDRKTDIYTASILNGVASHVLELDDGNRIGAPHLEAVILSTMIAIAQEEDLSFDAFARGILAGYESTIRLSAAIQPSHKQKGFHATGTCGTVGAAMAACCALDLNRDRLKSALSASASGAAGLLEVLDDNSELKPFNAANAILSGITAAYFGRSSFAGPEDALGGHRGFLKAFSETPDTNRLVNENGLPAIFQRYVKPYASCRHSHPAVECVMNICRKENIRPEDIDQIEVQTYKPAIYGHDRTDIESISAAKMSTPYSVAAMIVLKTCGIEAFSEENICREDIRALTQRISVVEDKELTALCPEKRGAVVTIQLNNGQAFSEQIDNPLGEPEHPMNDSMLNEKYDSLMAYSGTDKTTGAKLKQIIWRLEDHYNEFVRMI